MDPDEIADLAYGIGEITEGPLQGVAQMLSELAKHVAILQKDFDSVANEVQVLTEESSAQASDASISEES